MNLTIDPSKRYDLTIRKGNKGEQTMQAGNAVSVNAAQWIATRIASVLDGTAA